MPCFYLPEMSQDSTYLTVESEEYHHIINVYRKRKGDEILITNGKGILGKAIIEEIGKKALKVRILNQDVSNKKGRHIAAAFSLLKNKNDNLIVEKLTELGVDEFFPFVAQRSVRQKGENTEERFQKTAIAAIKQCDNPFLPQINRVKELSSLLEHLTEQGYAVFVALERDTEVYLPQLIGSPYPEKIVVFIGSEGGFTDEEVELFQSKNVNCFTICSNILRAETAAIAAVSQLILTLETLN
ncbi:MAG: RsmE family RNA methyltransferase [Candidatus Cloacimonas sp.]|nr:16S rRNA (uracil(1498)-N(3))-methyltransferase [Candidatus Cloacimonadota bacterium]